MNKFLVEFGDLPLDDLFKRRQKDIHDKESKMFTLFKLGYFVQFHFWSIQNIIPDIDFVRKAKERKGKLT